MNHQPITGCAAPGGTHCSYLCLRIASHYATKDTSSHGPRAWVGINYAHDHKSVHTELKLDNVECFGGLLLTGVG